MENEKIIIAHIIGKWIGGGVESVVMNYYRKIDRNKIQFHFLCDEDSTDIPYEEIERLGGKVILIPPYQRLLNYNKKLTQIFKENNYKIVHSHINTLSVFPLRIAEKCGIPIRIAHSHSTTNKKEWKKNLVKQFLKPFSKKYANRYMCCSELAGRWLFGDKVYEQGKVYLLNNAIDIEKFRFDERIRKLKRKELNIDESTFVVGHIGRFVAQKNHKFLIDVFNEIHKENKNSILLLAGQGPLMNDIREKVKMMKLEDCVHFLGQRNDINQLYQTFDVFCLPSLYEGLGMVLIEAQANGLPCVTSSEVPDKVNISKNVVFLSLNEQIENWAKTIRNIKNDNRSIQLEFFENAGFSILKEAKKLEKKYFDLINMVE